MDDGIDDGWWDSVVRRLISAVLAHFDKRPQHVGIVMDGNRRYAQQHGFSRKDGHTTGFQTMSRVLAVAYAAKIPEVTVYAFSIENFHRSPEEVADLMDIARSRLKELVSHKGIADQFGVRINIFGRLELLPEDVQMLARDIVEATATNTQATLNLAMPYTARDDMASGMACAAAGQEPITESCISKHMHTATSRHLDLLIRTSNTSRLSDFLLWEIDDSTVIDFVPELWPEYTPLKFLRSILRWRTQV